MKYRRVSALIPATFVLMLVFWSLPVHGQIAGQTVDGPVTRQIVQFRAVHEHHGGAAPHPFDDSQPVARSQQTEAYEAWAAERARLGARIRTPATAVSNARSKPPA